MKLDTQNFIQVSQILERDAKFATYKFALLRATIESIEKQDHHSLRDLDRMILPTGILVEAWIIYYYPLMASERFLPQAKSENPLNEEGKNIAFRKEFKALIEAYEPYGNFQHFYHSYKKGSLSESIQSLVLDLAKKIHQTITIQPMKYIGKSTTGIEYGIYTITSPKKRIPKDAMINSRLLLTHFGTYSISKEFYTVLKYLGGFISGKNAINNAWAEFIVTANKTHHIDKSYVLDLLSLNPDSQRSTFEARKYFNSLPKLFCIWSGKKITSDLAIDHVLPYSHLGNNDLWNLLPTKASINGKKSDKIPSAALIEKQQDLISEYWYGLHKHYTQLFEDEISINLDAKLEFTNGLWMNNGIQALQSKSNFLIDVRGFEEFKL
ncbi:MAG: HNH endonuclease domain-containing protein [Flavobacteriaceae bacterium]